MKSYKKQRFVLLLTLLSSIIVGVTLILYNFNDNIIFFYTPSEIKVIDNKKIVRIGGLVKNGSIIKSGLDIEFIITDLKKEIKVKFHGLLPTLFRDNQGTVVKGKFVDNYFLATEVLAKHDEKYMPKEVVEAIKDSGQWRP